MPATPPDIPEAMLDEAIHWQVRLQSGEAGEDDFNKFRQWLTSHPLHAVLWRELEADQALFRQLPTNNALALRTLEHFDQDQQQRRQLLKLLALGGIGLGIGGWSIAREPWRNLGADLVTGTGEQRTFTLADGTRLSLNTRSRAAVHMDSLQRLVVLLEGELQADVAPNHDGKPFMLETGNIRLNTSDALFNVQRTDQQNFLHVARGNVAIEYAGNAPLLAQAGQDYRMDASGVHSLVAPALVLGAWTKGELVARRLRLDALASELARYRRGWLLCDPAIAAQEISGVFQLSDIDQVLESLPGSLPVRIERRTRYWTRIAAV